MENYKVYPVFDINIVKAKGAYVWDDHGTKYLDMYGGHAVISIGHSHPKYVSNITNQVNSIGFYSNSIKIPVQEELAHELGELSGFPDYHLFLCNSGAEANENALKLASFETGRKKVLAFKNGFHGRTSLAVAATDNPKIQAPVNPTDHIDLFELNDLEGVSAALASNEYAAVLIEGIQGIGGIYEPAQGFLESLEKACKETGTILILDEIQSGYGRSGKFFAFQYTNVKPDLITVAKGMGNGFPMGGVLISPRFEAKFGQLGTTFGGNHLACAAGLAVLDVIKEEGLIANSAEMGDYIKSQLAGVKQIKEIRGKGLLLGFEFAEPVKEIRSKLISDYKIFTGAATSPNVLRLLPPMGIGKTEADTFVNALKEILS
ncbi:aminotransferase class III-fold pyridoxal phosphate-dependent enzyme [Reichenbachiella carrageenanivorans]|uniref:Aminotransferase class III-fold pyridoxal phosphate-dependent enzyme n=1 Tax=Reichenbachiella carrageenanivorans TaxID=2979869 RepID=A0ABY6CYE4_9BACT|nr:aminotransferase class III-fold pyridoxal phosphate-dependent enzyme [Reichenbachiella carrageenanivorans]UXX78744.1 aminotransferase class III-fold pyridoxal phosphate-dependent enzyme [Reichenbachiella carrageenanivorans]